MPVKKNTIVKSVPWPLAFMRLAIRLLNSVSPVLAGRLVSRIWFGAQRYQQPARETPWRDAAQQSRLKFEQHDLAVYSWGQQGPGVLLIHGWSGRGTQMGAFAEPLVQAGYRVLAFDAPGHGQSSGRSTHIFEAIEAVQAMNRVYGPFYAVVAHSFGCMVLARALRDGLKTERVVCISPPAQLRFLIDSFCYSLQIPLAARRHFINRLRQGFGDDIDDQVSTEVSVRSLKIPALIVHDENDRDVPLQQGQMLAGAWPGAELVVTRGLGHRRILRDRDVLQKIVHYLDQP